MQTRESQTDEPGKGVRRRASQRKGRRKREVRFTQTWKSGRRVRKRSAQTGEPEERSEKKGGTGRLFDAYSMRLGTSASIRHVIRPLASKKPQSGTQNKNREGPHSVGPSRCRNRASAPRTAISCRSCRKGCSRAVRRASRASLPPKRSSSEVRT